MNQPTTNAVIFGGTGYIGRNCAKRLADRKIFNRIILADIRRAEFPLPPRVEFQECDVRKPILPQLGGLKPDWIFNFAQCIGNQGTSRRSTSTLIWPEPVTFVLLPRQWAVRI